MNELGDYLKKERLKKGVSLEELSRQTKLSVYLLEKIEEGRFDLLHKGVITRSYLKSYSQFLNLKTNEILTYYERWYHQYQRLENPFKMWKRLKGSNPALIIVLLIILVIIVATFLSSR